MSITVFVDGQEGTTGLRIHEYLAARSDIEVLKIDAEKRKDNAERARLLNAADVAFLCLPDAAAREAAALVTNPNTCVIDASTAHRTVPGWTFGMPELAPGQRDSDSLPPYPVLDAILEGLVDNELSVADLVAKGFDRATVKKVEHLVYISEYKRFQAAPGTRLTRRAFWSDRRYPVANRWRDQS